MESTAKRCVYFCCAHDLYIYCGRGCENDCIARARLTSPDSQNLRVGEARHGFTGLNICYNDCTYSEVGEARDVFAWKHLWYKLKINAKGRRGERSIVLAYVRLCQRDKLSSRDRRCCRSLPLMLKTSAPGNVSLTRLTIVSPAEHKRMFL